MSAQTARARPDELRTVEHRSTEHAPRRILIIDPSTEAREFLRFCSACVWPKVALQVHDVGHGCPGAELWKSDVDLIVLEDRLGADRPRGLQWLSVLRAQPRVPPIIVLSYACGADLQERALAAGALAVFDKQHVSLSQFAEAVARGLQRASTSSSSASRPAATEAAAPPAQDGDCAETSDFGASSMPLLSAPDEKPSRDSIGPALDEVIVSGYRVLKRLGHGNVGSVFLAEMEDTRQRIALKVVRLSEQANNDSLRRVMREYDMLSRIDHKHIVRVHERGFARDFAFITMEYCEGGDLKGLMRRGLTLPRALDYLAQMLQGLGAAHTYGIVHRDIKPTNVLIRSNGEAVITDFGIAKEIGRESTTAAASFVGSAYYVSPESIRSFTTDPRGDLYSAGIVLYQMLVGKPPYSGRTLAEVLSAHLDNPIPRLPKALSSAQGLLDGLLAKEPDERFQSASETLTAIALIQEGAAGGQPSAPPVAGNR